MKAFLLLLSIAALVSAQYLIQPLPAYPSGGQQQVARQGLAPCGFSLSGSIVWNSPVPTYEAGRWMLALQGRTDNVQIADGDVIMFSLFTLPDGNGTANYLTNIGNLTWGVVRQGLANTPANNQNLNTLSRLRLGDDVNPGEYLLQMRYANYYSCARIQVNTSTAEFRISSPGAVETIEPTNPGQWRHFDLMYPAGANLVMRMTGQQVPNFVAVAAANIVDNTLPTDQNGLALETPITTGSVPNGQASISGICAPNFANQPVVYTVGVYTDAQAQPTDPAASIEFQLFQSRLNRSIDVPAHNGKMYFWTTARSSESDGFVRILLRASTGTAPTVQGATNCAFTTGLFASKTADMAEDFQGEYTCIEAPEANGVKYIRVDETVNSYTIYAEKGKCSEFGSASLLSISLALILAALFLTM